jgi:nucleoside-diphosphate-sugar epimerase
MSPKLDNHPAHRLGQRILVTGGLGRIALEVAKALSDRMELVLADQIPSSQAEEIFAANNGFGRGKLQYREVNLMDFGSVLHSLDGIEAVVHLAVVPVVNYRDRAAPLPDALDSYDEAVLRQNPVMTHHVLEAAQRAGVRRVINGSSLTVLMGNLERPHFRESDPPDPRDVYACSKLACEALGGYYSRQRSLPVYSLRIGQPYPVSSRPAEEWRTSARARSVFITMGDLARGIEAALRTDAPGGVYNLVSESDNPRVDLSRAKEMGYCPLDKFTAEGIWHRETPGARWELVTPNP